METVLKIDHLSKIYGQQYALKNVSLHIQQGEIYGLIGRNGAGKTTLLKTIVQLIQPTSGSIALFGSETRSEWTKALGRTGSVVETPVAYNKLTAEQNLRYYCKLRGIVDADKVIANTLEIVDLADTGKKKFKEFSLGMKQKLGIAIAILSQPDFLILDEPINGLDPVAIVKFRDMLHRLNEEYNMTIIISSHILSDLYHVATRFGIINAGQLVKEISKSDFDTLSSEYIVLNTFDVARASSLLKEKGAFSLKVVGTDEIHIFEEAQKKQTIAQILADAQIPIQSLYHKKQDLEEYFMELIAAQEENK